MLESKSVENDGNSGKDFAKKGVMKNLKIQRSAGNKSLDKEALRVVKKMPNWIPGKQNGKVVDVKYNIPITFKMQ